MCCIELSFFFFVVVVVVFLHDSHSVSSVGYVSSSFVLSGCIFFCQFHASHCIILVVIFGQLIPNDMTAAIDLMFKLLIK